MVLLDKIPLTSSQQVWGNRRAPGVVISEEVVAVWVLSAIIGVEPVHTTPKELPIITILVFPLVVQQTGVTSTGTVRIVPTIGSGGAGHSLGALANFSVQTI